MAKSDWEHALRSRGGESRSASGNRAGRSDGGSKAGEIVFKVASHIKTVRGTKAVADYIATHGGKAEREAFDESGHRLIDEEIHRHIDQEFGLKADADNLSPAGRSAKDTSAFKVMSDREKYNHRQSSHFILSLPVDHKGVSNNQLHQIAQDFLEPFKEADHKALYAIHRHQANPHIHFVVSFRDAYRTKGSTLNMNTPRLDAMREHGAKVARDNGVEAQATRRESREETVKKVLEGKEPLRTTQTKWKFENKVISEYSASSLLERQAPNWYERRGTEFEKRRTGAQMLIYKTLEADLPPLSAKQQEAMDQWASSYAKPETAKQSFLEMAAENERLAYWNARNRPQVFGELPDLSRVNPERGQGFEPITMRQVKLSEDWRREASKAIDQARMETPERHRQINFGLREINKKMQAPGQAVKQYLLEAHVVSRMAMRVGIDVDRLTFEKVQRGLGKYPIVKEPQPKPEKEAPTLSSFVENVRQLWSKPKVSTPERQHKDDKVLSHHDESVPFAPKPGHDTAQRTQEIYKSMDKVNEQREHGDDQALVRGRELGLPE